MALRHANHPQLDLGGLVEGIRSNDPGAAEQLYNFFHKGLCWYMARRGLPDPEDLAQDVLLATFSAIQRGQLREPNRLAGYVRGVARNLASEAIKETVRGRVLNRTVLVHPVFDYDHVDYYKDRPFDDRYFAASSLPDAEHSLLTRERTRLMVHALTRLRPKQREVLERFYLQEQTCEQICLEMNLSETQYRLLKSRAKTYLTTVVRRCSAQAEVAVRLREAHRRANCA